MKKLLSVFLCVCCIFTLALPAFAAQNASEEHHAFTIQIGLEKKELPLDGLSRQPYREGDVLMVPLRRIAEALGYRVSWDGKTGAITVDDDYIQKATLYNGTTEVVFDSHLKIIDMSRTVDSAVPVMIHDGCTYVPLDFFTEFFNDVSEENGVIFVAPSMNELASTQ